MIRRLVLLLMALGLVAGAVAVLAAPASSEESGAFGVRVTGAFSPNGDGQKDEAVVHYTVPEPGDVYLVLQSTDSGYPVDVRTVPLGERAAGDHTWRWDGRDGEGVRAPEDFYVVSVTLTTADGRRFVTDDYTHLDTSLDMGLRPSTTWGLPFDVPLSVYPRTEVVRDSVALVVWTEEVRQATLLIKDSSGRSVLSRNVTKHPGNDPHEVVWTARRGGTPLPPGRYRAFLDAKDLAGNEGRSAVVRLRVSREVLQWRRATRVVTPARSARGESYPCWTGEIICGDWVEPCGTVVPSAFYRGGLSYRSGECTVPAEPNGAEELHWFPMPQTTGVRGVAAARVAFTGRPTVDGETDAGNLVVHGQTGLLTKEAMSSTGARTGWVRGLRMGQGDAEMGIPPGVLWSFRTAGTDAVDVDRFTVTFRFLAAGN